MRCAYSDVCVWREMCVYVNLLCFHSYQSLVCTTSENCKGMMGCFVSAIYNMHVIVMICANVCMLVFECILSTHVFTFKYNFAHSDVSECKFPLLYSADANRRP